MKMHSTYFIVAAVISLMLLACGEKEGNGTADHFPQPESQSAMGGNTHQPGPVQENQEVTGATPAVYGSCLDELAAGGSTLLPAQTLRTAAAVSPSAGLSLTGFGTAKIDGVMSSGEWDSAANIEFQANLPSNDGGGTAPATLYVMNDEATLYLALKIARPSFGGATNPVFEFDNDNDGVREPGDDAFGMSVGIYSPVTFFDDYRYPCPGAPADSAGCGPYDTVSADGFPTPGTNDGSAAATNDGQFTYIEISHPLDSSDDLHDFSLAPEATVGFTLSLRLFSLQTSCNEGTSCYADTDFPACAFCRNSHGHIVVASSEGTVTPPAADDVQDPSPPGDDMQDSQDGGEEPTIPTGVLIDIKPGLDPNSINPGNEGTIPVAVLSAAGFDAPASVERSSLTFGRTGTEASRACCNRGTEDVNGDGLQDLICHFFTQPAGFQAGDTLGILQGQTVNGEAIRGEDSVRIVP